MQIRMEPSLTLLLSFLAGCSMFPNESATQESKSGQDAVPPYGIMFIFEPNAEERGDLVGWLDRFRAQLSFRFNGEIHRLERSEEYVLVFTPLDGPRAREVGVQVVGEDPDATYWTGIGESGVGLFEVLEIRDINGDARADITYCRADTDSPRVEALIRDGSTWKVDANPPSSFTCSLGEIP